MLRYIWDVEPRILWIDSQPPSPKFPALRLDGIKIASTHEEPIASVKEGQYTADEGKGCYKGNQRAISVKLTSHKALLQHGALSLVIHPIMRESIAHRRGCAVVLLMWDNLLCCTERLVLQ
jgi:hypothetical protein